MKSKFTEAFDSLGSDEQTRSDRVRRVLSADSGTATQTDIPKGECVAKKRIFSGKRGIALITAIAVFVAAVGIAVPVIINNSRGNLLDAMSLLENTYVDMDGVAAFGVWNAPDSASGSAGISNVVSVRAAAVPDTGDVAGESDDGTEESTDEEDENTRPDEDTSGDTDGDEILTGDWTDEERYDWESDYDWDPTKANVLIAIGDDGTVSEVVYERTNGRGQVRQDVLGNAATVYVSNGFTYVMYVSDDEWEFWKSIDYAQQTVHPQGFLCHHEQSQTVVIHNATGKVFALKDIIPQVNELSGATNYTLRVDPFKDDILYIRPMYGNSTLQWYIVRYDEETESVYYDLVVPKEAVSEYGYNVRAVRRDIYGQKYLLAGPSFGTERVGAGIVNSPDFTIYGDDALIFTEQNGLLYGTDGRMYVFDDGVLKVFGDGFALEPVSSDTEVSFVGMADSFGGKLDFANDGISYTMENGYLFSMFGEVWKVGSDGSLSARDRLEGSFPKYADDGYLIGGEVIAFVDTSLTEDGQCSVNGRLVRIRFDSYTEESPSAEFVNIISASEIQYNGTRLIAEQNEAPYTAYRGDSKYFLVTVENGMPVVEYIAYGYNGGVLGLVNPITEPLIQT